jgi:hypothetical protein
MGNRMTMITLAATAAAAFLTADPGQGSSSTSITTCGQIVLTNAFLAQDLDCPDTGIFVGASGMTIDLIAGPPSTYDSAASSSSTPCG